MNDALYNSDNMQSDGYDSWIAEETEKVQGQLVAKFYDNFERFPLPICFDPHEELKQLNRRTDYIRRCVDRILSIAQIRYNKKYFSKC